MKGLNIYIESYFKLLLDACSLRKNTSHYRGCSLCRSKAPGKPGTAVNTVSEKLSGEKKSQTVLKRSALEVLSLSGWLSIKR